MSVLNKYRKEFTGALTAGLAGVILAGGAAIINQVYVNKSGLDVHNHTHRSDIHRIDQRLEAIQQSVTRVEDILLGK